MTVKEWLNRGFKLNKEIEQLKEAKQKAMELACGAVADLGNEKVQSSSQNSTEDKMVSYAEYSRLLYKRIDKLLEINKEIVGVISKVDDTTLRSLLTARYINFKTWERIAEDLDKELRWIYRLHKKALNNIENVIDH